MNKLLLIVFVFLTACNSSGGDGDNVPNTLARRDIIISNMHYAAFSNRFTTDGGLVIINITKDSLETETYKLFLKPKQ